MCIATTEDISLHLSLYLVVPLIQDDAEESYHDPDALCFCCQFCKDMQCHNTDYHVLNVEEH